MTTVVLVLDNDGKFEGAYCYTEISFKVLKRGTDDQQIDRKSVV
jgi:hypothetical protein